MIKMVSRSVIENLIPFSKQENLCFNTKTQYCAYFLNNKVIGFCGWMLFKSKAILKNDYVLPEYRKQGIYKKLNEYRMNVIRSLGMTKVEANLTDKSLQLHLSDGAKIIKKYKCCTKVVYEIYKNINVFDEALNRIRWIFDEFPNVICNVSGGKDSTVVFHLCLQVAKEKSRLPLKVLFIDQEAEWQATIDQVKTMMYHPDVEPKWYQIPIKLFNATSSEEHWLQCWDEKEKHRWMRDKDPIAIKENVYNQDRFAKMFGAITQKEYPNTKMCYIAGVRTEESPSRALGLTVYATYKWATWGNIKNKKLEHYSFYPIYDWSYTDVWKAIHDNKWIYNKIYDIQYRYGMAVSNMRVSNVHHETAVHSLFYMQEAEPETYVKLTQRIAGIDMACKMGKSDYFPHELPFMFASWKEYRDYLVEKLITNEVWRESFKKKFVELDNKYANLRDINTLHKTCVMSILTNDWEFIKIHNMEVSHPLYLYRKQQRGESVYDGKYTNQIN